MVIYTEKSSVPIFRSPGKGKRKCSSSNNGCMSPHAIGINLNGWWYPVSQTLFLASFPCGIIAADIRWSSGWAPGASWAFGGIWGNGPWLLPRVDDDDDDAAVVDLPDSSNNEVASFLPINMTDESGDVSNSRVYLGGLSFIIEDVEKRPWGLWRICWARCGGNGSDDDGGWFE